MRAHQKLLANLMTLVVACVLCGLPEIAAAQQNTTPPQNDQQNGTTVNPAQPPLQPVPQETEPAPSTTQPSGQNTEVTPQPAPATPAPQPKPEQQMQQQPLGAATAEGVPTVGGGASRPAGEAIAPAKQKQRRSLLIKIGLIVAVGAAVGIVYGLSKGTSSKP